MRSCSSPSTLPPLISASIFPAVGSFDRSIWIVAPSRSVQDPNRHFRSS
jgi:hypothetical protein